MKIIGIKGRNEAICEIGHEELEKFLGLYYGKSEQFKVGQEIDLAKGFNHHREILSALETTRKFFEDNKSVVKAITDGIFITQNVEK